MSIRRLHPALLVTRTITTRLATRGYPVLGMPTHGSNFCSKCKEPVVSDEETHQWVHEQDRASMCRGAKVQAVQNLVRSEAGNVIHVIDYSQIELRVLAELSRDKEMRRAYVEHIDLHAITAHGCLGAPKEKSKQDKHRHRLPAKTVNFSMVMGTTPSGLTGSIHAAGNLEWSATCPGCKSWKAPHINCDSKKMMEGWFKLYKGAAAWMQKQKDGALDTGFAHGLFGTKWYLPGVWCIDDNAREEVLRQTHALPVQGGAQKLMSKAMAAVYAMLPTIPKKAVVKPFLQQHDSLIFEVSKGYAHEWDARVKKCMEHIVTWSIPIEAEGSLGPSWLEQEAIK